MNASETTLAFEHAERLLDAAPQHVHGASDVNETLPHGLGDTLPW